MSDAPYCAIFIWGISALFAAIWGIVAHAPIAVILVFGVMDVACLAFIVVEVITFEPSDKQDHK